MNNKRLPSWNRLAWTDLLFGIISAVIIIGLPVIHLASCYLGLKMDCELDVAVSILILVLIGPFIGTNLIFSMFSFKFLRKMNPRGITMSYIPKIIMVLGLVYFGVKQPLKYTPRPILGVIIPVILIIILLIWLGFVLYSKVKNPQ